MLRNRDNTGCGCNKLWSLVVWMWAKGDQAANVPASNNNYFHFTSWPALYIQLRSSKIDTSIFNCMIVFLSPFPYPGHTFKSETIPCLSQKLGKIENYNHRVRSKYQSSQHIHIDLLAIYSSNLFSEITGLLCCKIHWILTHQYGMARTRWNCQT